jgi:hypothetical protein
MEKKTLEIAIPDGKTPKMTETESSCVIEWVDKEKAFEDYADAYRCGMPYAIVPSKKPMLWPFENRMGLLKYIANDLNEEKLNWENCDQTKCALYYDHERAEVEIETHCHQHAPATIFTLMGAHRSMNIIPVEFLKTL